MDLILIIVQKNFKKSKYKIYFVIFMIIFMIILFVFNRFACSATVGPNLTRPKDIEIVVQVNYN